MMFPRPILLVLFNLLAADAFVVNNPSSSVSLSSSLFQPKASTCLRAEEDGEIETQEEASGDSSTGDILNSPAFLKRKIDVLQSDIAQAEADIEAAQAQAEAGKAEWASQIEDLQTEVSYSKLLSSFDHSFSYKRRCQNSTKTQLLSCQIIVQEYSRENVLSKQRRRCRGNHTSCKRSSRTCG